MKNSVDRRVDRCFRHSLVRLAKSNLEKAVILVLHFKKEYNLSFESICRKCKIHHESLKRAVWSYLNGFPIGKAGRSRVTNPDEERELVEFVKQKWLEWNGVNTEELIEKVKYILHLLTLFRLIK
jgi:hypothetical protein